VIIVGDELLSYFGGGVLPRRRDLIVDHRWMGLLILLEGVILEEV